MNINCKEFELDDLIAIAAIPIADIPASDPASPVNLFTQTIPKAQFNPTLTNAITIGKQAVTTGGILIPIRQKTGKVKDDESDSVAGRIHTVTVTCEVDDRGGDAWEHLLTLERTPRHLLLTFQTQEQGFVSATEDTYVFTVSRDGSKATVTFNIHDLMGIQLLV